VKRRRLLFALSITVTSAALLSGCAIANVVSPPFAAAIYATPADAANVTSSVALPAWIPADAMNIRIKTDETKHASILMFTATATAPVFTDCSPDKDPDAQQNSAAGLDETWWPQAIDPTVTVVCNGAWHIFGQAGFYYAWTP
jgi:hypothetical protein